MIILVTEFKSTSQFIWASQFSNNFITPRFEIRVYWQKIILYASSPPVSVSMHYYASIVFSCMYSLSAFFCEYDAGCCPGAAYLSMEMCASTGRPQAVSTVTSAASNIYQTNKAETRNHDNANCVPLRS